MYIDRDKFRGSQLTRQVRYSAPLWGNRAGLVPLTPYTDFDTAESRWSTRWPISTAQQFGRSPGRQLHRIERPVHLRFTVWTPVAWMLAHGQAVHMRRHFARTR